LRWSFGLGFDQTGERICEMLDGRRGPIAERLLPIRVIDQNPRVLVFCPGASGGDWVIGLIL